MNIYSGNKGGNLPVYTRGYRYKIKELSRQIRLEMLSRYHDPGEKNSEFGSEDPPNS